MADPVTIAGIGLAISAVGAGTAGYGQYQQAQQAGKAEKLRKSAMILEEQRKRSQLIREAVAARGTAVSNASAQGAGSGSGLAGGIAQIGATQGRGILASNQDQTLGSKIFTANARYASAGGIDSIGGAVQGFGGQVMNQNTNIASIFA